MPKLPTITITCLEEVIAAIYAAIVLCSPTTNPPSLYKMRPQIVLVHKCYNCKPCHLKVKAIGTRSYNLFV
ncbi:hypothetical protein C0Q70_18702 [Pomacea canaliculata]|uniref:Uncharacterized protein n=1 Tax=Pomacea canaliculata TaxID=400727 RepID=A0A2T7NHB8_POMCA|nr:hypothetical protein C0Q70_18702 [Pomacea canaliculata]